MPPCPKKRTSKPKLFQCFGFGDCRMIFTRSEHLARHTRKHTGEKPFTCIAPDCPRMFSRFDNMMQHTQTHRHKEIASQQLIKKCPCLTVEPFSLAGQGGLVSPVSLSDDDDAQERRLSIADMCNPHPELKEIHLTVDEFEALQAFGQFGHTPVYYDSLRDLASTACIEPNPARCDALLS